MLSSQDSIKQSSKNFIINKKQKALDIEFIGIDYTYTRTFNKRSGIGIGLGGGLRIILNNPEYLYCGGGCDEGDCCSIQNLKAAYFSNFELVKLKVFWRYYLTKTTYFNTGIFGSIGELMGGDIFNMNAFTGFQFDFYTGGKKLKAGLKFQAGKLFLSYGSTKKSEFYIFTIIPALQFHY